VCTQEDIAWENLDKGELDLVIDDYRILRLINFDELFSQNSKALIINNSNLITDNLSKNFTSHIFRNMDDTVSFVAACECGHLFGNYNIGIQCPKCNTIVSEAFINKLQHDAWLSIPDDIFAPVPNPIFYMILKENVRYKKNTPSIIDMILNTSVDVPDELLFLPRGFRAFYNNFDDIFLFILEYLKKNNKKGLAVKLDMLVKKYRNAIFCTKLPILNSALHTIASEGKSLKYVDKSVKDILSAIMNVTYVAFIYKNGIISQKKIESDFYKVYVDYISYLKNILCTKLGSKFGLARRHMLGSRLFWSFRGVITPVIGTHNGFYIECPWKIAITTYLLELYNLMLNRYNYTSEEAIERLYHGYVVYDEFIHELLNILIEEARSSPVEYLDYNGVQQQFWSNGLSVLVCRNPTLAHGSIQLFSINKIKSDINDETVSISSMVLKGMNGLLKWPY
jgi:hypothetical protein